MPASYVQTRQRRASRPSAIPLNHPPSSRSSHGRASEWYYAQLVNCPYDCAFYNETRSRRHTRSSTSSKTRRRSVRVIQSRGLNGDSFGRLGLLILGGKKVATKEKRWYKDVGLGFKTPAEAVSGTYIGMSCMFAQRICGSWWTVPNVYAGQTRSARSPVTFPSVAVS